MKNYYQDIVTAKSWQQLVKLKAELETTAVPELNLNRHFFSRKKKDVFKQLFS